MTQREANYVGRCAPSADSVSVNRRHCGTRRRAQNAQFWLTPSARRALIAAEEDVRAGS
jgi:hypothetical protein